MDNYAHVQLTEDLSLSTVGETPRPTGWHLSL